MKDRWSYTIKAVHEGCRESPLSLNGTKGRCPQPLETIWKHGKLTCMTPGGSELSILLDGWLLNPQGRCSWPASQANWVCRAHCGSAPDRVSGVLVEGPMEKSMVGVFVLVMSDDPQKQPEAE